MKTKLPLILVLVFLPVLSFGQCPPDGLFESQAEIGAFAINYPDCTQLDELIIDGDDIVDLSGLNQILGVGNFVRIINNPQLQNLNGLNSSLEINYDFDWSGVSLIIENNAALTNISALSIDNTSGLRAILQ